ncbi:MAG: RNA-splicing ligase RtcB, partial [Bacillati bacterium ANGP1]
MPQATFPLVQRDAYRWEIPPTARPGMRVPGIIYADASLARQIQEDQAVEQLANTATL